MPTYHSLSTAIRNTIGYSDEKTYPATNNGKVDWLVFDLVDKLVKRFACAESRCRELVDLVDHRFELAACELALAQEAVGFDVDLGNASVGAILLSGRHDAAASSGVGFSAR